MADIGTNDTIHGYNPSYQRADAYADPAQYLCFQFPVHGRPGNFINNPVYGSYTPTATFPNPVYDHQGHIVPQNLLSAVLKPIAEAVSNALDGSCDSKMLTLDNVATYLETNYADMAFDSVNRYIRDTLIAHGGARESVFVTTDNGDTVEERVGGYFSVLIWNPVNLCRAPSDDKRAAYPGNAVDDEVRNYLLVNNATTGLTADMSTAFNDVGNNPSTPAVQAFITACNTALMTDVDTPKGYYAFAWQATAARGSIVMSPL